MLSMVGGALQRINGVKDPTKMRSQCQLNKKDSVLQYQPTPIHVLKAKSAGSSYEYDPVSNFSASSSRVTLPISSKRPQGSEAVSPAKRSKLVIDDDVIEARFSDSEEEQSASQTSIVTSGIVDAVDNTTSAKQPAVKVPKNNNNSQLQVLSTNLPASAATVKSSATVSQPKDSTNCLSSSASQRNVTVNSNHVVSAKMPLPSAVLSKDNGSGKQRLSNSSVVGDEKLHKERSSSTEISCKYHHENTDQKVTESSKTKRHDSMTNHHSSQSSDATGGSHSNKVDHKHGGSSTQTKSYQVHSSEDGCSISAVDKKVHRHSNDKHQECHTHGRSKQSDKAVAMPSSHSERQKEKLPFNTSAHNSKTNNKGSSVDKHSSSHRREKEHKTSHDKDGEHKQSTSATNSHRSLQVRGSHTDSHQSRTAATASGTESKSLHHKHYKHSESTSVTRTEQTQLVGRGPVECATSVSSTQLVGRGPVECATSVSSTLADKKRVNTVQNIELFGEDSDTESGLQELSPISHQVPVKRTKSVHSKSCHTSEFSDDVTLLPIDDPSHVSDTDDTFEQCQQLYNELARQQQSAPATCTTTSSHNVSCLLSVMFQLYLLSPP